MSYTDGALYIRVSTDKQEELSPDAQKRLLLDYAKKNKILVRPEHIFTENGISGRNAKKTAAVSADDCPGEAETFSFPGNTGLEVF